MTDASMTTDAPPVSRPRPSRWREPGLLLALAWLLGICLLAILAPVLGLPSPEDSDLTAVLAPPGAEHWLGTDSLGRDTFARLVHGGRVEVDLDAREQVVLNFPEGGEGAGTVPEPSRPEPELVD